MESELQAQFDRDLAYQVQQKATIKEWQEFEEWAQWSENNLFQLADGTVLDGKINP
jgi:hypothetical protein